MRGKRLAADSISGGDLMEIFASIFGMFAYDMADRPKVLVCWDRKFLPRNLAQAAGHPGPPERKSSGNTSHQDRLAFFAKANNASLGRVKASYLEWARERVPHCEECQHLNRLFSQYADGYRVRVSAVLEQPPTADPKQPAFMIDVLYNAAQNTVLGSQKN